MMQPDTVSLSWRRLLWGALGFFLLAYGVYVGVMFLPAGVWGNYIPEFVQHTYFLPYAQYETPFSSHKMPLDYYVFLQYYRGAALQVIAERSYVQLGLFVGLLVVLLALSTYLKRYWFWVSQGLLAALLYSCNLQHVRLWGRIDQLPYGAILLALVLTAWRIQHRGAHISLAQRMLSFGGLFLLLGIGIHYFSAEETPFLILSHQSYYAQLCMVLLFCLLVGHEIPYLLLRLSTAANLGDNGWVFVGAFLMYFLHLVLFFLRNTGYLDWDLYYVDEFVFLAISAIIGLWGLQARAHQYSYLLPASLLRLNYLALGGFALLSVVYFQMQNNDPAVEVIEDTLLFGHIGFGIGFFSYVLMNFRESLFKNLAVWRVVYEDVETPFLLVRLFGLVGIFVCYSLSQKAAYNHALSGGHMHLATLYTLQKEDALAEHHYKQAAAYGYQSHGPNYALGQRATASQDPYTALSYYSAAAAKHPSPQAYLELGNTFYTLKLPQKAQETWQQGLEYFPKNAYLATNLSFYGLEQGRWDSLFYYVKKAAKVGAINGLGAAALQGSRPQPPPSVSSSLVEQSNYLATLLPQRAAPALPLDTGAYKRPHGLVYTHNYALALLLQAPEQLRDSLKYLRSRSNSPVLSHDLLRLQAFAAQATGNTDRALRIIDQLKSSHRHAAFYAYLSGLWAYEAGGYSRATDYFLRSYELGYAEALEIGLQMLAMWPEVPLKAQKKAAWEQLGADTSKYWQRYVLRNPFLVLEGAQEVAPLQSALEGYPQRRHKLGLAFTERLLDEEKAMLAAALLATLPVPADSSLVLQQQRLRAECLFATFSDSLSLSEGMRALSSNLPHHQYLRYLLAPDSVAATKLLQVAKAYPFQQQLVVRAAEALQRQGYPLQAYNLLLSAIETHPYAPALQKAYILQALHLGQERYAAIALSELQKLLKGPEYAAFLQEYHTFRTEREALAENWYD